MYIYKSTTNCPRKVRSTKPKKTTPETWQNTFQEQFKN